MHEYHLVIYYRVIYYAYPLQGGRHENLLSIDIYKIKLAGLKTRTNRPYPLLQGEIFHWNVSDIIISRAGGSLQPGEEPAGGKWIAAQPRIVKMSRCMAEAKMQQQGRFCLEKSLSHWQKQSKVCENK